MKIRESGMPEEEYWETFFNVPEIFAKLKINGQTADAAEFGSGYGTFTIPAAKIIKGNIYAFDIEEEMITLLNRKAGEEGVKNIIAVRRDFVKEGTGLKDNSVNYTMLFNILHAENPVELLKEAYRILKPGGIAGIIHWIYSDTTPRGPSMAIRPTPAQCAGWIKEAGFTIIEEEILLPPYHYGITAIKD